MKLDCTVTADYCLVPLDKSALKRVQQPGNIATLDHDNDKQRSTVQLAKYWCELEELCANMSEAATKALLANLIDAIAQTGQIRPVFIHDALKQMHGIDSIALSVDNKRTREYFDFAFQQIERMKRAFYA